MERGIVTPELEIITNGKWFSLKGCLPQEQIKYFVLYWDKVVIACSKQARTGMRSENQVLVDAGILRKETVQVAPKGRLNSNVIANMHFESVNQVMTSLTEKNPGQWAIHQTGNYLYLPKGMSRELVTADFELHKCLPVPLPNISMEKLIEFKFKRKDELTALRTTLDELYLDISNSQDIPRAKVAIISRLEKAISDLDAVAKESWGARILATRKVSLDINLGNLCQGVATGGIVGSTFQSPVLGLFSAVGQTVASSMKFEIGASNQLASSVGKQIDLSYLSNLKHGNVVQ
ncbi:hypothetical protein Q9X96_004417 [Vibrio vulnificus]|uniref:DUF6236 family protein n=1 Tax=Vibrio vulnificus TaxID=672 RepID=UPI0005F12BA6|nr:DUF6236 family protein [Vibrio vulnificus]ELH4811298.1 hypothetical protein [Vibrio vulnificus]HAS8609399.1 hypothetical protein [Vibrio vulnificus]